MARKSLEKWISEALDDPDKEGKLQAMSLVHYQGSSQIEVHSMKFVDGTNYNPQTIANTFNGKAETDCQNLVGMQQYCILAFYGGSVQPGARFPMLIDGEAGGKFNGLSTEGPDPKGQTQQAMRLTETIVKGSFGILSSVQHFQQEFMRSTVQENRELRTENREMLGIMKEVLLQQTQLSHEQRMKEAEVAGNLELKKTLFKAIPVLTNQLTGKEVFPQSSEDTALIEMMAEHMDPEKVAAFLPMLGIPAAAQGALMSRLTRYMQEKREGQERIKAIAGGNTSAELDFPTQSGNGSDEEDAAE